VIRPHSVVLSIVAPVLLVGTLSWVPAEPCSKEEIASLKSEYREKAQQLADLENATPLVDQLSEIRGYLDVLNEAAGETKTDINEFVKDNEQILKYMKTEVTTYHEQMQKWAPSVYQNDALEGNTTSTTREVSVTEGLNVTAERLGQLEDITGKASGALAALEAGAKAQTPSEQLAAFRDYFDTMTGLFTSDEMKAAFPILHVFAPWFEFFSRSLEFATDMTESIQRSIEVKNRMLRELGYSDISYSAPQRSPYEILAEQKEKLEAELTEIEAKLRDCGQDPPGRPTTGSDVDAWATERADFDGLRTLCFRRTGRDQATADANEAELRRARGRANAAAHRLSRARWRLGIKDGEVTGDPEIMELEADLRAALTNYEDKLAPVKAFKDCILQEYLLLGARKDVKVTKLQDLPDEYQYKQFKNCNYWNLDEFATSTIGQNLPDRPATGGDPAQSTGGPPPATGGDSSGAGAPTGGEGGDPEAPEAEDAADQGVPAPEAAGNVSVPGAAAAGGAAAGAGPATGGGGIGMALAAGAGLPLTKAVEPIDFEIEPGQEPEGGDAPAPTALPGEAGVATQGSDSPVTGDAPPVMAPEDPGWIDPTVNPEPLNSGYAGASVDETTQPMMLDVVELTLAYAPAGFPRADGPEAVPGHGGSLYLATDGEGGLALIRGAEKTRGGNALSSGLDDPKVTAILTSLGVSTGEAFEVVALNEGDIPIQISGDGIVVEPVKLKEEAQKQLQAKLGELASRNPVTAKLNAYCLEFLARPPTAGQLFRIASTELQQEFAPMRNILKAGRQVFESGFLNPDSDPIAYMHSIKQWALWTHEKGFDQGSFTEAFIQHTKKNFEAADRDWNAQVEDAVRAVLPNRWNDIQQVLRTASEARGPAD
jgi:hypothetical protein